MLSLPHPFHQEPGWRRPRWIDLCHGWQTASSGAVSFAALFQPIPTFQRRELHGSCLQERLSGQELMQGQSPQGIVPILGR